MSKPISSQKNNQLTSAIGYDTNRMIFSEPTMGTVPDSVPPIMFRRINISTLNPDGSVGDLCFPTERIFSFGVSENRNPETKKVNGYVLPLCLWNRDGASKNEKAWTDTFDKVIEKCKEHLINNREEIEQYELAMTDLKKLNNLYWKKDKGKVVEGTGPTLYAKLISTSGKKKNKSAENKDGESKGKILSMFFNVDGETLDPLSLMGKYCYTKAVVKFESIFIGNKITVQIKLYEAEVETMESGMKPLMARPKGKGRMLLTGTATNMNDMPSDEDERQVAPVGGGGSLHNSDDENVEVQEAEVAKTPPKPVVRKIKKVLAKK